MKKLLAFLLLGLAAFGFFAWLIGQTDGPTFIHPVVVVGDNVALREDETPGGKVIAYADKGDTLELGGLNGAVCQVERGPHGSPRFKNGQRSAYIARRFLSIPAATLAKARAGTLDAVPAPAPAPVEHLSRPAN